MTNKQIVKYNKILTKIALKQWGRYDLTSMLFADEKDNHNDLFIIDHHDRCVVIIEHIKDPEFLKIFNNLKRFALSKSDRKIVEKLQFKYLT